MDEYTDPDGYVAKVQPNIPVTCFRPAALEKAGTWFTRNFPGRVLYAVKVNPAPYVLHGLRNAGINAFDVASPAEIRTVYEQCPGAFMAYMNPVKGRFAIEQAYFDYGVRDFSFDTMDELKKIVAATGKSKDLGLFLRLKLPVTGASGMFMDGKYGAPVDAAPALLAAARKHARCLGISFHAGSQTMDPAAFTFALGAVEGVLRAAPRVKVDVINVGGGFPAAYPGMMPPPLADFMEAILNGFDRLPNSGSYEFWCEPGRSLVAESASMAVRVIARRGDVLYLNDGVFGSLFDAGSTLNFRFPMRLMRKAKTGKQTPFRLYGPTCTSEDYMPGPFSLPDCIREGDFIEIGQMGAYGNVFRTDFNGFGEYEVISTSAAPLVTMYGKTSRETKHRILSPA